MQGDIRKPLSTHLSLHDHRLLDIESARTGSSKAEMVRKAIEPILTRLRKQAAKRQSGG
jgi:predicted DNA-binding protein